MIRGIYAEHGSAVLAYATRLAGDHGIAEDVMQETLLKLWRNPDVLGEGKGSIRAWLFTVAHNLVVDKARAKAVRPTEVADWPASPPLEQDHADRVVDSMALMTVLNKLSPEHRDVLVEIYLRERSLAETAETLGLANGTVKSRSHYALRAMRKIVSKRHLIYESAAA